MTIYTTDCANLETTFTGNGNYVEQTYGKNYLWVYYKALVAGLGAWAKH